MHKYVCLAVCNIAVICNVSDVTETSIPFVLNLLHPKLQYQMQLAKKMELLEALKVCSFKLSY